jgi:predicted RNase H-like nuclease
MTTRKSPELFVGVDGCKQGWVTVELSSHGFRRARLFSNFAALLAEVDGATCIAVDIPFGLADAGARTPDTAARKYLGGQSSSVFPSPPRPSLLATDFAQANEACRRANDKGISQQSFALFPKIREVDAFIADERIFEVHPEVSFRVLNRDQPLNHRKKTWGGIQERRRHLASAGIELSDDLGDVNNVGVDDVLDAAIAAWSARRITQGHARSFPSPPTQRDASGRVLAIWA